MFRFILKLVLFIKQREIKLNLLNCDWILAKSGGEGSVWNEVVGRAATAEARGWSLEAFFSRDYDRTILVICNALEFD